MFLRLKQKVKEESTSNQPVNDQPSIQLIQNQSQENQSNKEHLILEEKSTISNETQSISSSSEDTTKYQSSSDETTTSDSVKSNDMTPVSDLKSQDLLCKYEKFIKKEPECENTVEEMNENDIIRNQCFQLNSKYEALEYENISLKETCNKLEFELNQIKNEKDDLIIKNADLSQKYELLKLVNCTNSNNKLISNNNLDITNHKYNSTQSNETNSIFLANKDDQSLKIELQKQLDENKFLKDDLNEKNKMIKNLQQRLNDMKKTLQKELKYQSLPNETTNTTSTNISLTKVFSPTMPSPSNHQLNESKSYESQNLANNNSKRIISNHNNLGRKSSTLLANNNLSNLHDDVNFKYLKHVVLKFVTSREYEAIHLVKALSVLLNLNIDEEKILKETLEWKMSWFGSRPKIQ